MPKTSLNTLNAETDPQKRAEIIDENYEETLEKEDKKIDKTLAAQNGKLDKVYFSIYYDLRMDFRKENRLLTDSEKYEFGASSNGKISEEEMGKQTEITGKVVSDLVNEPTLQQFRDFYFMMGMIKAKAAHELHQEHQEIKNSLPPEYDKDTKEKLADVIALEGNALGNHLDNYVNNLIGDMLAIKLPGWEKNNNLDYGYEMNRLTQAEFRKLLNPPDHPTMTVGQYMDYVDMSDEDRKKFLKKQKCTAEDNFYDLTLNNVRKLPGAKTEEVLHNAAIYQMCESCSSYMPKKWMREGEKQYKSGLTKSELMDYENGQRVSGRIGAPHSQTKKELTEKGINVAKLVNERSHRNIIKGLRLTQEKLTSGKALRMRDVAGYSEAITGGARERITEHAHVTKGALLELQSIPTQWKYHSSDSKEYTKALNALKDYHMALARNDGGKASEFQTRLCKAAYDYLKDKRSTRSHPNGRKRFNAFMTLLYEELKPSEFQKVVDKVNQKRKDGEKVSVEEFEAKKNRFMKASRKDEKAFLDSSGENATRLDLRSAATVMEMDDLYKPEQYNNPREPEKPTIYAPVGLPIQAGHKGGSLSMKDFAAVSFASALSSRQRDHLLIENNILLQSEEAAAEGKKVSDAAFKAYGEGDKVPLAKLLTIGIRKLNEESAGRTGSEKACMTEMSQRIFNMLQRDPELQKYAERQGLTKEDMKAAGKTAEELKKEPEVRNIIHEEGLIL